MIKHKERQAIEREQHNRSYEEIHWAELSPAFREAYNRLRQLRGLAPLPPPKVDLYVPRKGAKIWPFRPPGRNTIHQELFALIRKIHDAYMADRDPRAQPKTKSAAVEQVVNALNPKPDDDSDQSAYDEWEDRNDLIKRTAYEALKPSKRSRGKSFDNSVGPPLDEGGAKEWFETLQFSRQMRRKRRRTGR